MVREISLVHSCVTISGVGQHHIKFSIAKLLLSGESEHRFMVSLYISNYGMH